MTTKEEQPTGDMLKVDVLGRVTIKREEREKILDAFEASGMTGQAFAIQHGIKVQTFASWIQKRRRARELAKMGSEEICCVSAYRETVRYLHSTKLSSCSIAELISGFLMVVFYDALVALVCYVIG